MNGGEAAGDRQRAALLVKELKSKPRCVRVTKKWSFNGRVQNLLKAHRLLRTVRGEVDSNALFIRSTRLLRW